MLAIVLNIISLICMVFALVYICILNRREKDIQDDIFTIYEDIKYYFHAIEDIFDNFDELLGNSLYKLENMEVQNTTASGRDLIEKKNKGKKQINNYSKNNLFDGQTSEIDETYEISSQVFELKEKGLTNEEIARQLKKSIREIDVALKIWSNIKNQSNKNHNRLDKGDIK